MPCKYWDAGWCYAPLDEETTAEAGACARMDDCPQSISMKDFIGEPLKRLTFKDSDDE